jgi:hypothetical protein
MYSNILGHGQPYFYVDLSRVVLLNPLPPSSEYFLLGAVDVRGVGVLAPTWWFGRCVDREPGMLGRPEFGVWMMIYLIMLLMHRKLQLSSLICYTFIIDHFKACIQW